MAIIRAQVAIAGDTAFPRDRMVITPHFKVTGPFTDYQNLCDDLANAFNTNMGSTREVQVKLYDAEKPRPNPPQATKTLSAGLSPASVCPREVALCLSYFADSNVPRRRGRLYIPATWFAGGALPPRPTQAHRDSMVQYVNILKALGGVNVDWCVFSRRDAAAHTITNWFCDDDWDTQRRRGLRPTTRSAGTLSG